MKKLPFYVSSFHSLFSRTKNGVAVASSQSMDKVGIYRPSTGYFYLDTDSSNS